MDVFKLAFPNLNGSKKEEPAPAKKTTKKVTKPNVVRRTTGDGNTPVKIMQNDNEDPSTIIDRAWVLAKRGQR